jgi:hypothetical protein
LTVLWVTIIDGLTISVIGHIRHPKLIVMNEGLSPEQLLGPPFISPAIPFIKGAKSPEENEILYQVLGAADVLVALTTMLNSKGGTSSVRYSPSIPENARRCRKRLFPFLEVRSVIINVNGENYHPNGSRHGDGHHAPPRLHWRRGHVRRLHSGTITNVRPCLVGSAELGTIDHDKYAVR